MSGLIFNGNGDVIRAVDGSLTVEGLDFGGGNIEAGIGTFTTLNVTGVLTYEDVKNVDSVGIVTAREGIFLPDTKELKIGNTAASPDLKVYHSGTHSFINNSTGNLNFQTSGNVWIENQGGTKVWIKALADAAVELYHNNNKKLETTSSGISVTGSVIASSNVQIGDSDEFIAGDGNDLRLWHNATDSYIKNFTGDLWIQADGDDLLMRASDDITLYTQTSDQAIVCVGDGGVELYWDNSKKFETKEEGVQVTGRVLIGTSTEGQADADNLTIADTGNSGITIRSGTSSWGSIYFSDGTSGTAEYDGWMQYTQNHRYLSFGTAGTTRLNITSDGHALLGDVGNDNAFFKAYAADGLADDLYVGQFINAEATAGRNYGVNIQAGSNNTDHGFRVKNHAGTVQFIIQGDGDIGLGESAPNKSGYGSPVVSIGYNTSNNYSVLELLGNKTSDASISTIVGYNVGGTSRIAAINFLRSGANNSGAISFETYLSGSSAPRLHISPGGDIGIGDNNPSCRLAIADPAEHAAYASVTPTVGNCMLQLYNHPPNETANDHATMQFGVNGGSHNRVNTISAVAESAGNRKLAFTFCTDEAGSRSEKLRITGDGELKVSTNKASGYVAEFNQIHTSNSAQIKINSPTDSNARPCLIDFTRAGTIKWSAGMGYNDAYNGFHICMGASLSSGIANSKFVITSDGRTGIGNYAGSRSTPVTSLLHVATNWDQGDIPLVHFEGANNEAPSSGSTNISFQISDENSNVLHKVWNTGGGNSDLGKVYYAGKMGIGDLSPDGPLHVTTTGETNIYVEGNASTLGSRIMLINRNTTANSYNQVEFCDAGGQGTSSIRGINVNDSTNEGSMEFWTRPSGASPTKYLDLTATGELRGFASNGKMQFNKCQYYQWGGSAACNATWSVNVPVLSSGNIYKIVAYFSHHANSYAAYREGIYGAYSGHGGVQMNNDLTNHTSTYGGSWTISRANAGDPVVVTHNAGSYNGSGYWFVWVLAGTS